LTITWEDLNHSKNNYDIFFVVVEETAINYLLCKPKFYWRLINGLLKDNRKDPLCYGMWWSAFGIKIKLPWHGGSSRYFGTNG
jgi:hypothetical protein